MKTIHSVEFIVSSIVEASRTEERQPYNQEPLVTSSKAVVSAILNHSCHDPEVRNICRDAMTYFATDICYDDIEYTLEKLRRKVFSLN